MAKTIAQIQEELANGLVSEPWISRSIEDKRNSVKQAVQDIYDRVMADVELVAKQHSAGAVAELVQAHELEFHGESAATTEESGSDTGEGEPTDPDTDKKGGKKKGK